MAVFFGHNQILRHVNQTTSEVTGVSRLQSRISQTLTGTVSGNKVLQYVQTFTEVSGNRGFDNRAVRLSHQTTHTGQLANLSGRTTSTGVGHHVNRVERLLFGELAMAVNDRFGGKLFHHHLTDLISRAAPNIHNLVVAFTLGNQTGSVLRFDFFHFFFCFSNQLGLLSRHLHIADADRQTADRGQRITAVLQAVGEKNRCTKTALTEAGIDQTSNFLLLERTVQFREAHAFGQDFRQQGTTGRRFITNDLFSLFTSLLVNFILFDANRAASLKFNLLVIQSAAHFGHIGKEHAFAHGVDAFAGRIVKTQHHVLRRNNGRIAVCREKHVIGGKHQRAGFQLSFQRQRHVHSHLVTVEVSVKGCANERVQLNGLAFNQFRFKRLNTQAVQGRGAVKHHGMLVDHFFENIPNHRLLIVHHLLGGLDGHSQAAAFQLVEDERLEQFQSHQLRQAALMQTQIRANRNHGTAGVVHALTQKVLTEAAALTLDHVGKRLQRALGRTGHRLTATAVIEQAVHSFLQHALFVTDDDVRSLELKQTLQAIVTVDDATVQIVEVGCGETAAIQRNQRTKIRRQHRQNFQHHPFGLNTRTLEAFEHLQALGELLDLSVRGRVFKFLAQRFDFVIDINGAKHFTNGFGAHHCLEVRTVLFNLFKVFVFGKQLTAFQIGHARINHAVGFEIQHPFDVTQRDIQNHTHAGRQAL